MKDLDFDELDKAVNSLMSKTPQSPEPSAPENAEKVLTLPESPVQTEASTLATPDEVSDNPPIEPTPPSPVVAPAAKRGGRFMDVVHPSSDMRSSKPAPSPVRREGVTLAPLATPQEAVEPPPKTTISEQTPPVTAELTMGDWPDPIEQHDIEPVSQEEGASENDTLAAAPTNSEDSALPETISEEQPTPSSPFLPDAKVEKRPLSTPSTELQAPLAPSIDDQLKTDPTPPVTASEETESAGEALPAELGHDVLSIESDNKEPLFTSPETSPIPDTEQSKEAEAAEVPAGPVSITQQYKQQPSSGDQHHEAIYDSANIAPAAGLAHPPKKNSGWLVIGFILLLILVGAGGAAALYYFHLI